MAVLKLAEEMFKHATRQRKVGYGWIFKKEMRKRNDIQIDEGWGDQMERTSNDY